jgi:DNA-binding HxlR family transcriptional regulator
MPTSRSYGDACGIARALDVLGERWALLVVRELLLGPQRFTDLRRGLANASSNLVADRLRELQEKGVIRRRKLAPPAGSWVYELTSWGRQLEPTILALGEWGLAVPCPASATLSPTSAVLYLRRAARPDPGGPPITCRVELDGQAWTISASAGKLEVQSAGEPATEDVSIQADPVSFISLLDNPESLDTQIAEGNVVTDGDLPILRHLLHAVRAPSSQPAQP